MRVRQARQRHRNRAALIIQTRWNEFIKQKRRYEASYAQLKSRLYRYNSCVITVYKYTIAASIKPPCYASNLKMCCCFFKFALQDKCVHY